MGISSGATYEKAFGKHIRNLLGATPAFYLHLPLATKLEPKGKAQSGKTEAKGLKLEDH